MWRALRKALKSTSNSSRCLGQIPSSAEKGDGTKATLDEQKDCSSTQRVGDHRKLVLNTYIDGDNFHVGFNIQRLILGLLTKNEKPRALRFSTRFARGKDEDTSNPFSDEVRSWCNGVLTLSSLLACRKLFTDEKSPLHVNVYKIPSQVLSRLLANKPYITLGVIPITERSQTHIGNAKPTDAFDEAIASFQSNFSECTAAAQNKLGIKFASMKQHEKAYLLFAQASERGHPLAQFNLGLCFELGKGVDKDLVKAAECYKNAVAQGQTGAMYNLALFYMEGLGGLPKDSQHSLKLLEEAAENGLCKAQLYLGLYYADESSHHCNYSKAIPYLEMAAGKRDPSAEFHLGVCYERGLGTERSMSKAANLYKSAALHGHTGAQYNMGVFYENGLGGCSVNKTEATRYYRMAAEAGDEDARHNLLLLRKQMEAEKRVRHPTEPQNLVFSLFKQINQPSGMQGQRSLPRCSSSPGILDAVAIENKQQSALATSASKPPNPLLAF